MKSYLELQIFIESMKTKFFKVIYSVKSLKLFFGTIKNKKFESMLTLCHSFYCWVICYSN